MKRLFLLIAILLAASMTISVEDAQAAVAKKKQATSGELFES